MTVPFVNIPFVTCIYIENFSENDAVNKLQHFSRLYFGNFVSLTVFLKSLAPIEKGQKKKKRLEEKFKKLLEIWNIPTET